MSTPTLIVSIIASCVLSYAGVALVRRWARRRQYLDIPNERSSHQTPTPRGGGLAIVVVVIAAVIVLQAIVPLTTPLRLMFLLLSAGTIAAVSWIDDLCGLPAAVRLAVHLCAAIAVLAAFRYPGAVEFSDHAHLALGWLGAPLTLLWIVGLTNAYNFMDGIDGIAAMQGIVAAAGWLIVTGSADRMSLAAAALLLGALLGFLPHNYPRASIFMGDVGAAFLGFLFGILPLTTARPERTIVYGVLFVWPFVFDTCLTFLRRLIRGERVLSAHRSHIYQRLTQTGLSHAMVASLYGFLAASGVAAAAVLRSGHPNAAIAIVALLAALLWLFTAVRERARTVSSVVRTAADPSRSPRS